MALTTGYTSSGHFYVYYIDTSGNMVIARYTITAKPNLADIVNSAVYLLQDQIDVSALSNRDFCRKFPAKRIILERLSFFATINKRYLDPIIGAASILKAAPIC